MSDRKRPPTVEEREAKIDETLARLTRPRAPAAMVHVPAAPVVEVEAPPLAAVEVEAPKVVIAHADVVNVTTSPSAPPAAPPVVAPVKRFNYLAGVAPARDVPPTNPETLTGYEALAATCTPRPLGAVDEAVRSWLSRRTVGELAAGVGALAAAGMLLDSANASGPGEAWVGPDGVSSPSVEDTVRHVAGATDPADREVREGEALAALNLDSMTPVERAALAAEVAAAEVQVTIEHHEERVDAQIADLGAAVAVVDERAQLADGHAFSALERAADTANSSLNLAAAQTSAITEARRSADTRADRAEARHERTLAKLEQSESRAPRESRDDGTAAELRRLAKLKPGGE